MSFALTTAQFLDGSKTVTRRMGWRTLKAGDRVRAVKKAMGLKKGEHPEVLGVLRVLDVRREVLESIDSVDVAAEGFPRMDPTAFVTMFCHHMKCERDAVVTRIQFRREV